MDPNKPMIHVEDGGLRANDDLMQNSANSAKGLGMDIGDIKSKDIRS